MFCHIYYFSELFLFVLIDFGRRIQTVYLEGWSSCSQASMSVTNQTEEDMKKTLNMIMDINVFILK